MTYEERLEKIVFRLKDERDLTRKGHKTKVTFDDQSFTKVGISDTCKILLQLQDDEKSLKIVDSLQPIETVSTEQIINPIDNDNYDDVEVITIELDVAFDEWYTRYVLQQKSKPTNLDWLNLLKIVDVCSDIDEKLQINRSTTVTIPSFPYPYIGRFRELFPFDTIPTRKAYQQHRYEGSQYLLMEHIALDVKYANDDVLGYGDIVIVIDPVRFSDFYKTILNEFEKRKITTPTITEETTKESNDSSKPLDENKSEIVYQIIYTKQRQVLMNNAQISKPDFNSENDLVFSFLYENPNRRIGIEEIEKAVGGKLTKSLHKIVENLGFEGDTKEVFFSVSKKAIEFRNPITKKDLEEMKKPLIKLVKGGGKLVLPH